MGEGRLRGPDLSRPFHGVRTSATAPNPTESDLDRMLRSAADFAPLLVDGRFFSHTTAAAIWGCPLPPGSTATKGIHVSARSPRAAPRGEGVVGHQAMDPRIATVVRYGFAVSDAASTWLALASLLPLDELVVVGDHLVLDPFVLDPADPRPFTTMAELQARTGVFHGRGARRALTALGLARLGAESRPETLLRLLLLRARLPEPQLNLEVRDARGRWLGRSDLVWPAWRTVAEYDGDQHRSSARQYDNDISRIDRFIAAGWKVVRVRKRGLFVSPQGTVARVTEALESQGWRP
jgi:very-short-patch-repair endonuclease